MLSLQSQLSSPGDEVGNEDAVRRIDGGAGLRAEFNEDALRRVEDRTGKRIEFNEDADMDVESSSDSGWSVRDNPIASDESATEESSEEEKEERHSNVSRTFTRSRKGQSVAGATQAVSPPLQEVKFLDRGNTSDHSKSPENGQLGSLTVEDTGPCHQSPKPPGTPDANIACSSCTESQRKRSAMKAQEWDLGLDVSRAADDQRLGARRSMSFETLSDISQGTKSYTNGSIDEAVWVNEGEPGWCTSLVRSARKVTSIAEAVLGGSLCVVIAVPLTMLLARVLQSPQDPFLVPT